MKYIVIPNFNKVNQQVALPAKNLNIFMKTEMQDTFGVYQRLFGLYSYMRLNKKRKYTIHTLTGNPMIWQPAKACSFDPTGALRIGKRSFEPCEAKMNEEFCDDELMNSCFDHLNTLSGGRKTLDAAGVAVINEAVRTIAQNATLGARLTLTGGQLYDPSKVKFNSSATQEIKDLFRKTANTCRGWVELAREMGEKKKYSHMNLQNIFGEDDFDGTKFSGDVVLDIYDKLLEQAPNKLCGMIDEGGVIGNTGELSSIPLFVLTTHLYKCLAAQYRKECRAVCRDPRLTQREFTVNTGSGSRVIKVYYIDDTPVIPLHDLNCYDEYLTGSTHLAAITVGGNIGLGASFDALPDAEKPGVGILLEKQTSIKDAGKIAMVSQSLFAVTIADSDCFVGSQVYAESVK